METRNWKRQAWIVVGAAVLIAVLPYMVEARTENNIRLMAEACERLGAELQIERISWFGSVQGSCANRSEN